MIQLDLNMKMPDKCSECNFFRVHNKLYCTAVVGNTTVSKPRERRPAWCPLHEVTDTDTISRQAAIDAIRASTKKYTGFMEMEMYTDDDAVEAIEGLSSAQPDLPEWARKVEEYRKSAPDTIYNPLAWALYQAWKEYDR